MLQNSLSRESTVDLEQFGENGKLANSKLYSLARDLIYSSLVDTREAHYPDSQLIAKEYALLKTPEVSLEDFERLIAGMAFQVIENRIHDNEFDLADLLMKEDEDLDLYRTGAKKLSPLEQRTVAMAFWLLDVGEELPCTSSEILDRAREHRRLKAEEKRERKKSKASPPHKEKRPKSLLSWIGKKK